MTIIFLILENNFYVKNTDSEIMNNINQTKSEQKEEITIVPPKNLVEKEEIILEKEPPINQVKKEEVILENKTAKTKAELEKIILDREKQVKENNKSLQSTQIEEEIPEIISMVIAKIISEEKTNNQNITLESYNKQTWNSAAMGCPLNGMSYAQVETTGYKINILKLQEKAEYHTDLNGNYINCTEISNSNSNANFNFVKKYELENVKKIELILNENDKLISSIEDKEKIKTIIESINIDIDIGKTDICEADYKLVFEKKSSSTVLLVFCKINPYYVYADESINAGETILNVVEEMLSSIEFPGMPK